PPSPRSTTPESSRTRPAAGARTRAASSASTPSPTPVSPRRRPPSRARTSTTAAPSGWTLLFRSAPGPRRSGTGPRREGLAPIAGPPFPADRGALVRRARSVEAGVQRGRGPGGGPEDDRDPRRRARAAQPAVA